MVGYKDMTFCPFYDTCKNPCHRALTAEVREAADKWWFGRGGKAVTAGPTQRGAPICVYSEPPRCHPEGIVNRQRNRKYEMGKVVWWECELCKGQYLPSQTSHTRFCGICVPTRAARDLMRKEGCHEKQDC